jgi:hypothetical protein
MWRRWLALAVLVVAVSGAAAWVTLSADSTGNSLDGPAFPTGSTKPAGPSGTVKLEPAEDTVEFGVMDLHDKTLRRWTITNSGPGDLVLTGDQPYCSCTVMSLKQGEKKVLKPGETFDVEIEYEAKATGPAEKSARIFTSDPKREQLVFSFKGKVFPTIVTLPEEGYIDAGTIPNTEPRLFHAAIATPARPETKIVSITSSNPDLLEVVTKPLTAEERQKFEWQTGEHLEITVKPSSKLGMFNEEIIVKTDHPKKDEVRLNLGGRIIGPISATPSVLRMGDVTARGHTQEVSVWVTGQDVTHFEVASVPRNLKAAIAPADDTKGAPSKAAGGRRYRLTVTVPPGTPPGVIEDPIVLTTDHPKAAEFRLPVQITVLGEG